MYEAMPDKGQSGTYASLKHAPLKSRLRAASAGQKYRS